MFQLLLIFYFSTIVNTQKSMGCKIFSIHFFFSDLQHSGEGGKKK
jgi:hypothetical protein